MPVAVRDERRVRVLTLDDPARHNCVSREMAEGLAQAIETFGQDDGVDVLVVTGAGEKSFCSGMDLKAGLREVAAHRWAESAGPLGFARLDPGKPTIAAINGYCFAAGMELAAWCDFRIAADDAEFGALNRRFGVPFTDGGTQQLVRHVGRGNALYLIETGVRVGAERALAMGLVQETVPVGQALPRALELAHRMTAYPQDGLRADRRAVLGSDGMDLARGLAHERDVTLPVARAHASDLARPFGERGNSGQTTC